MSKLQSAGETPATATATVAQPDAVFKMRPKKRNARVSSAKADKVAAGMAGFRQSQRHNGTDPVHCGGRWGRVKVSAAGDSAGGCELLNGTRRKDPAILAPP